MPTPFDYVNSINAHKDIMLTHEDEQQYVPFVVNRALSYFPDTLALAQQANKIHNVDNKLQYHYLINTVSPRKRFAKWAKKRNDSDLQAVKQYYKCNDRRAEEALSILTPEQLSYIAEYNKTGET